MGALLEIRKNIYYTKAKSTDTELNRVHEIVLIISKPEYKVSEDNTVYRSNGCEEVRFLITSDLMYDTVLQILGAIKNSKEEDLH
jgi:hypothetical protein